MDSTEMSQGTICVPCSLLSNAMNTPDSFFSYFTVLEHLTQILIIMESTEEPIILLSRRSAQPSPPKPKKVGFPELTLGCSPTVVDPSTQLTINLLNNTSAISRKCLKDKKKFWKSLLPRESWV